MTSKRRRCSVCRKPLPPVDQHPDHFHDACRDPTERERIRGLVVPRDQARAPKADLDCVHMLDEATTDWGKPWHGFASCRTKGKTSG
jgi:hypothetical protein